MEFKKNGSEKFILFGLIFVFCCVGGVGMAEEEEIVDHAFKCSSPTVILSNFSSNVLSEGGKELSFQIDIQNTEDNICTFALSYYTDKWIGVIPIGFQPTDYFNVEGRKTETLKWDTEATSLFPADSSDFGKSFTIKISSCSKIDAQMDCIEWKEISTTIYCCSACSCGTCDSNKMGCNAACDCNGSQPNDSCVIGGIFGTCSADCSACNVDNVCVKCSDIVIDENNIEDSKVDVLDGTLLGLQMGKCNGDVGYNPDVDLDNDGCIDDDDSHCLNEDFGKKRIDMPECSCDCVNDGCCKLGCAAPGDPDCSCVKNTGTCCGAGNNCTGSTMNSNSSDCSQSECCQNAGDCPNTPPSSGCQCNYTPWVNNGECGEGCEENEISQIRTEAPSSDCGAGDCGELSRCYKSVECMLNLPDKSISDIIEDIIDWLLTIVSVIVIIMLIIGGVMYITAVGDETRLQLSKKIIVYAIIGLLIVGISYIIVKEISDIIAGLK